MDAGANTIRSVAAQAAWIALAFALCPLAALVSTRDPSVPVARMHALVDFERSLGLFFEAALHAWLQRHDWLLAGRGRLLRVGPRSPRWSRSSSTAASPTRRASAGCGTGY